MRIPYLVIINDEKSFVYTDKRKIKKIFNEKDNIKVYVFKTIDKYNCWVDIYELYKNNKEVEIKIFKGENDAFYSDLGCSIMRSLAKAEWNSSIKYPDNGWHICSVCGDITNNIDRCLYCDEFVCWDCSHEVINNSYIEGDFCSYECYRKYGEKEYNIEYNPEKEYKEKVCDRLEYILGRFEKEQLLNVLIHLESSVYDYDEDDVNEVNLKYKNKSKEELLNILERDCDTYDILMKLYEDETDEYLSDILDGEGFINNLDPNDPADEWFFED